MTVGFGPVTTSDNVKSLIVGKDDPMTRQVILAAGQNLIRGSMLGRVTSTGKFVLSLAAASDGSQAPIAVLAEDTNAASGDRTTLAHFSGVMNENAMVFGAGFTALSAREALRTVGFKLLASMQ